MAQVAAAHAQVALPPAAAAAAADGGALEGKEGKCFSGKTRKITHINDHYEIGKKLGSGYTATVYEATCKETARQVALKDIVKTRQRLIATDDYYRLVYEVLTRLPPHRHLLLPPLALLETSTHFYIVMELCHGRDLVEYVLKHPPGGIPTPSCQRLMQQLLLGVHFLHSHNILHRDIKLDNIIFRQSEEELGGDAGQGGDLALLDFDMCLLKPQEQQTSSSLSSSTEVSVVGTREYMAPECFKGQYSTASDIWSLGVILYILLDGHFPFDVNACNASSTPPSPSPAHESQQQQQNMFSGRAIRRLLRQGVQFFSGMKNKHPVATDLIEKMLKFDVHARMQTAFDALHHPWLLPVPSPVPRQQQHQQQQRSSLLPLQQGALPPSKDAAAAAPWPLPSVSDQQQQQQLQKQQQLQQQQQLLLLHHREAHCWGPSSMLPPLGLSRSDASASPGIPAHHLQHFLRQQMARRQQLQQQQRLPQLRQHQQQQQLQQLQQQQPGAATAAAHPLIEGTRIRRTPLAATAAAANAAAASAAAAPLGAASVAAGSPCKEVQVHRHFQQQRQPFISRHPCSVSSPQQQQQQLQHSAICDSSTPPRSSIQGAGPPPPLGGPGASQQQTPATQQPQQQQQQQQQVQQQAGLLQEQACMRRQPREQQKCLLHLPHAQSHKMREGATQGLIPGSAVSTRLPSSLPPSSQPNDFLGQVPLSPSSRYPSSFRAAAAAAAATAAPAAAAPAAPSGPASVPAAACTQSSFTPYSSATTSASCSKPSTPTLDSLPPRREDAIVAAAVAAAQLQQQLQQQQQQLQLRSAGVQRTVSRPAAVSGVSLVVQLQQRLQQQQQQQQLAQLQNRRFILQQQLQHHLLQQHITRRSSLKSAQAAESSLHADCAKAQHAPPQSSSNSRGSR